MSTASRATRALRVPHTLVLLFAMMVAAWAMTWLLPQGVFETTQNEAGRAIVVAGTFETVDERVRLSPLALLTAIPRAMADAAPIIFFVLIVGGAVGTLRASGAIDAGLGRALHLLGARPGWLITGGVTLFAIASAALGTSAEYIPLVAILAALAVSLHFDRMTAVGIVLAGYGAGYGVAFLNPFTVLAAHEVPPAAGQWPERHNPRVWGEEDVQCVGSFPAKVRPHSSGVFARLAEGCVFCR